MSEVVYYLSVKLKCGKNIPKVCSTQRDVTMDK